MSSQAERKHARDDEYEHEDSVVTAPEKIEQSEKKEVPSGTAPTPRSNPKEDEEEEAGPQLPSASDMNHKKKPRLGPLLSAHHS